MVHRVGVEPWALQCSNHAWAVFRVLCPVERAAFSGSRAWLALETEQFDFAEPGLAEKHRGSSLRSWAVAHRVLQQVEDGPQGEQRGELQATWGVSKTLCQWLLWFFEELISAGW